VFDETIYGIDKRAIPLEMVTGMRVRAARREDADALLDAYHRHHARYSGSFAWDVRYGRHRLDFRIDDGRAPSVVEDESGRLTGYLYARPQSETAGEVVADSWPAAVALLQHHALCATAPPGEPTAIWWRLPPDSPTLYLLAAHLPAPEPAEGEFRPYALRGRTSIQPNQGWQARPAHLATLLEGLAVVWQERWRCSPGVYRGAFTWWVDDQPFTMVLDDTSLVLALGESRESSPALRLTMQSFTQLILGYRPTWWIEQQPGTDLPPALRPLLEVLCPPGNFWIPGTDAF
jgi:hypothetical protein